jgi:hypothetical protein
MINAECVKDFAALKSINKRNGLLTGLVYPPANRPGQAGQAGRAGGVSQRQQHAVPVAEGDNLDQRGRPAPFRLVEG